ncbi:MAG: glycosyltransferase family 2 protein [Chthoniobacteraceae bacterium]
MAFHALLCTRDEDDIIRQSLLGFLEWADAVHVLDTGSVDRTWEVVQEMALRDSRIKPVERRPLWFSDQLRGYLFERVRSAFREGDWILRTDSDEFYHIAPPTFARERLRRSETCVYHQYFDFKLTKGEAARLADRGATEAERTKPIAERRMHYVPSLYAEPRMCRYRARMSWPLTHTFPVNAGFVAQARLPIRHYPNRDPFQMRKRVRLRKAMIEAAVNEGRFSSAHHWRHEDWTANLVADDDPSLRLWSPGRILPDPAYRNHLAPLPKRIVQRLLHAFAVRHLDRHRQSAAMIYQPEDLPDHVQEQMRAALDEDGQLPPG